MKYLLTTILTITSITTCINSASNESESGVSIDCTIGKVNYVFFNQLLSCTLNAKTKFEDRNIKVDSVCGITSTAGVRVFYAISKIVKYIPKNLKIIFPDLTGFRLESTQLKLISKEDLLPFPDLEMFASVFNQIEFLEQDLFINNPQLKYVSFRGNKISYIHPDVFNSISGTLQQLYMDGQVINCGIGNPTTQKGLETALSKLINSQCTDIRNAPALYTLWLELKLKLENGSADNQECEVNLQEIQEELTATAEQLAAVNAELETLRNQEEVCREKLGGLETDLEALDTTVADISGKFATCCDANPAIQVCLE